MPSAETVPVSPLSPLMDVARRSLEHGARVGRPLPVEPAEFPSKLQALRSCFVTLRIGGRLRGCIGSIEAREPLVVGVAQSAFKAGFRDPRFPPLEPAELPHVELEISILTPLERLHVASEAALLAALRPGIDGLALRDGPSFATFLPAVWDELSEPAQFVSQLKRKAGLHPDHWSEDLEVWRYTAEKVA
jgi:AmmeMemoRadiSam system protein A